MTVDQSPVPPTRGPTSGSTDTIELGEHVPVQDPENPVDPDTTNTVPDDILHQLENRRRAKRRQRKCQLLGLLVAMLIVALPLVFMLTDPGSPRHEPAQLPPVDSDEAHLTLRGST